MISDHHRVEWAVLSDDGQVYEVADKSRYLAFREAGLLREQGEDARVVERRICDWSGQRSHLPASLPTEPSPEGADE